MPGPTVPSADGSLWREPAGDFRTTPAAAGADFPTTDDCRTTPATPRVRFSDHGRLPHHPGPRAHRTFRPRAASHHPSHTTRPDFPTTGDFRITPTPRAGLSDHGRRPCVP
ncbi:hypothetical protein GCM10022204_10360 [Microlunatus aurantiacus]|uniref:Uncharacterized protein n=1 Tax=Microlunatus aurantiacus TaxID=446786 RepID=A0ABP7CU79_9ACTN